MLYWKVDTYLPALLMMSSTSSKEDDFAIRYGERPLRDAQRGQVVATGVAEGLQKDTVLGKR
jgi:hypothetical protein